MNFSRSAVFHMKTRVVSNILSMIVSTNSILLRTIPATFQTWFIWQLGSLKQFFTLNFEQLIAKKY